ncbi:MAG: YicC/YloC family endoribonuclease [Gammaproteobacteria bacterium]|nr:YicC/YloC family endoribonuclease [Gammaproteobacteria bacterium]
MLKSMTAYARQQQQATWGSLIWELRSVNHRYLEITLRLPEELRELEPQLREQVGKRLKRGKVECNLRFKANEELSDTLQVNEAAAKALLHACHQLEGQMMNAARLNPLEILNWPGIIKPQATDLRAVKNATLDLLSVSLDDLIATREREGERIDAMLQSRHRLIAELSQRIAMQRPAIQEKMRNKLRSRFNELNLEPDNGRLEQELVYLAQKQDIDEELDRLNAHLKEVDEVLQRQEPVGRRLDFLMQELNREANTLGAKASDVDTSGASVELKVLIEQMREQIQNVE